MAIPSVSNDRDIDLAVEEDDNENSGEPKTDQLEFMNNLRKGPNIAELQELEREYIAEQREQKKRKKAGIKPLQK